MPLWLKDFGQHLAMQRLVDYSVPNFRNLSWLIMNWRITYFNWNIYIYIYTCQIQLFIQENASKNVCRLADILFRPQYVTSLIPELNVYHFSNKIFRHKSFLGHGYVSDKGFVSVQPSKCMVIVDKPHLISQRDYYLMIFVQTA